jgi:hypothetical protein
MKLDSEKSLFFNDSFSSENKDVFVKIIISLKK